MENPTDSNLLPHSYLAPWRAKARADALRAKRPWPAIPQVTQVAQIFVSAWLTFSLALVAQIFASAWLKYSLTFTLDQSHRDLLKRRNVLEDTFAMVKIWEKLNEVVGIPLKVNW